MIGEAIMSVVRQPVRSLLCALGTVIAVGAFTTTEGLTTSASNAVAASFNELQATTVVFQGPSTLSDSDVTRLTHLRGVVDAGLVWDLHDQQPVQVGVGPSPAGQVQAPLAVTAMSASALPTIGATLESGRFYDATADRYHQMVALLGSDAAAELGISSTLGQPAINVMGVTVTVVGIVSSAQQESQALFGVIVPPYVAEVMAGRGPARQVIARTSPGAAQLIGRQGPIELDPWSPGAVSAEVPPDPTTLRSQVEGSLNALLSVLSFAGLGVGFLSIMAVTVMSVAQRRTEIGLRRAVGYSRKQIAMLIMLEASAVGVLGGVIGASGGVLATSAISSLNHWTPVMNPLVVLVAPLIGIGIGALAGVDPAGRAARITPMAALRT
jgi:putative ABC transport system permease protein